ncbi:methyltransferase domain-containing protein [Lewinella sp. LCG006]|uniref:methyltransferase domain-containing protein n=1 Tax=Lewinella sp. LCG006 TaxID=3231911 RepID=UPI0034615C5A
MIFSKTRHRSQATEIMDDFEMKGELLRSSLDQIATINQWLGGNSVTLGGLKALLQGQPTSVPLRILDLGCGNGDLLRLVAKWGRKTGRQVELIGIDGNAFTVNYARKLSQNFPEISYRAEMIPSPFLAEGNYDVVLCTLFLHHFATEDLQNLLVLLSRQAKLGIVINDLHRSHLAYFLFNLITLFIPNRMIREDGLTSILRGFKKKELLAITEKLPLKKSRLRWCWAFRYQWILWTDKKTA